MRARLTLYTRDQNNYNARCLRETVEHCMLHWLSSPVPFVVHTRLNSPLEICQPPETNVHTVQSGWPCDLDAVFKAPPARVTITAQRVSERRDVGVVI